MVDVLHAEMGGIEMKWIEYTRDNKQIEEINRSESFLLKRKDGAVSFVLHPPLVMNEMYDELEMYSRYRTNIIRKHRICSAQYDDIFFTLACGGVLTMNEIYWFD